MKTQTIFLGHVFPYINPDETYSLIIAIQKQSAMALHICHCVKIYTKCLCEAICNIAIIDSHMPYNADVLRFRILRKVSETKS